MKLIAHRGNYRGKDASCENRVQYVEEALNRKFDVEIDLWKADSGIFLGHDKAEHAVDIKFLEKFKDNVWIHAKSIDSLEFLSKTSFNWFWHERDAVTLTSKGNLWAYPEIFIDYSVVNQPSDNSIFWKDELWAKKTYYGICHDNLEFVKTQIRESRHEEIRST
jgi:hypothetical protein